MYCPCSENKDADQLRGYREADLRVCFRPCKLLVFSRTGSNFNLAAPVAEWLRSLTSVLLIIRSSHRCGFAPRTGHEFICETSHVLLAGVSGGFSPGTPVFAPPTD